MGKNEIIKILDDWNFWNRELDTGIKRDSYINRLLDYLETDLVVVITGVRRSGKSFIMRQLAKRLLEKGVDKNHILIVNFEDPRFPQLNVKNLQQIYEIYLEFLSPKETPYIFLDEVQEVEEWEKWVRTMRELKKAKVVISGSNAKLLSRELSTLLTGMHIDLTVFPLSFIEFLHFNGLKIKNKLDVISHQIEIKSLFRKYLEFGAFPEVTLHNLKREILLSYYDDILNKDLIRRFNIRKGDKLKELARFYMSNISNLITFNSLEKVVGLSSDTIEKFSQYLVDAYTLFLVNRFSYKLKEQTKSPKKVYAIDTGLANAVGFKFSENWGRVFENVVFLELKRKTSINPDLKFFYWKDIQNKEVDFVVQEKSKVKEIIQVCWNLEEPRTKSRELRSLRKAMEELKMKQGIVITEDFQGEEVIKEKLIKYFPLWSWCLETED